MGEIRSGAVAAQFLAARLMNLCEERERGPIKFTSPKKKAICYDSVTAACVRPSVRPSVEKKSNFFDELPRREREEEEEEEDN